MIKRQNKEFIKWLCTVSDTHGYKDNKAYWTCCDNVDLSKENHYLALLRSCTLTLCKLFAYRFTTHKESFIFWDLNKQKHTHYSFSIEGFETMLFKVFQEVKNEQ